MRDQPATENYDLQAESEAQQGDSLWTSLARDAYRSSEDYFNSSLRREFEASTAHFHSRHAPGSKYLHPAYAKRSRSFRPKTRATIRNNEMAVAVALFSTQDVVHITPVNDSDPEQVKACKIKNHILNFRLNQPEMNWFMTVIGGCQDAMTAGAVISRQSWVHRERKRLVSGVPQMNENGSYDIEGEGGMEVVESRPSCDPVPLENMRLFPGADWRDPIRNSPYVIEMVPMTVGEIRQKAKQEDPLNPDETIYRDVSDMVMRASVERDWDSVRRIREGQRVDKYESHTERVNDFKTVWVHKNIVRLDGYDYCFDTLGPDWMLSTKAKLIEEVTLLGERPYTYGVSVIEAHKMFPAGIPKLTFQSQEYANDIANLRQDNIRLTLSKRYWVRRGAQVDVLSLKRNVAGGVTMMNNPDSDVKESATPDVTRSAYEEQDRLNADFDEVAGSFSPSSVNTNRNLNETVGGMNMLSEGSNMMQEYMVRTCTETWVERTLRQIMTLIENYEADRDLLQSVASSFKIESAEDVIRYLQMPTQLRVNAGFGATNPLNRVEKLGFGLDTLARFMPDDIQRIDKREVTTEVMGALGYRDGERFFPSLFQDEEDIDPRIPQLEQQVAQLMQMVEGQAAKAEVEGQIKIDIAKINQETALLKEQFQGDREGFKAAMKDRIDQITKQLEAAKEERERLSLALEREALSHAIQQDNREFALQVRESEREGAEDLKGEDRAGMYSRDDYDLLPGSSL